MKLKLESTLIGLSALLLGIVAVAALTVAAFIQIDYSDSYAIFLNARALLGETAPYSFQRGIIAGLLQVPWFALEKISAVPELAFRVSKIFSAIWFIGIGAVAYDFYRRYSDRLTATLSVLFLMTTSIFIHYLASAKEDMPATFFTLLGFSLYLRYRRPVRFAGLVGAGTCFAFAMGLRYNLIPLFPLCILLEEFWFRDARRKLWNSDSQAIYFTLLFWPLVLLLTFPMILFPLARDIAFFASPYQFLAELLVQFEGNKAGYKPPVTVVWYLLQSWGGPGLLLALLGILETGRKRDSGGSFFLIWLGVFFLAQTFLISGKEARYLFPFFPALAFLAGRGGAVLVRSSSRAFLRYSFGLLILVWAGNRAGTELWKFTDPFYRRPFPREIADGVRPLLEPGHRLIWMGTYFEQHPKEAVFHPLDDYAYVYHYYAHVLEFFMRRPVNVLTGGQISLSANGALPIGVEDLLQPGDVLVINPDLQPRVTRNLTDFPSALWIQKVEKSGAALRFYPAYRLSRVDSPKTP